MRNLSISLALCTFAAGAALAAGCSAPDPGVVLGQPVQLQGLGGGSATGSSSGSSGATSSSGTTGSSSGTTSSSGSSSGTTGSSSGSSSGAAVEDGGTDGSVGTAFLGEATAWASALPATTAYQFHSSVGQAQQTPTLDCMQTCHAAGGAGGAFVASGWVATAAGGATGAADVEIRVYSSAGAGISAHTDANGYFWILPPNTGAPTGAFQGGARNGTTTQIMPNTQTNYDCNNSTCHGGTTGPIHLP